MYTSHLVQDTSPTTQSLYMQTISSIHIKLFNFRILTKLFLHINVCNCMRSRFWRYSVSNMLVSAVVCCIIIQLIIVIISFSFRSVSFSFWNIIIVIIVKFLQLYSSYCYALCQICYYNAI